MGVRTRSVDSSPAKAAPVAASSMKPACEQRAPLKLFILPKDVSSEARFLLLGHPRDGTTQRFFFCPEQGLFEFTKVASPSTDFNSVLLAPCEEHSKVRRESEDSVSAGYVNKTAEFCVATPFEIAFLLLPILAPSQAASGKALFQPLDDLLEEHLGNDRHLRHIYLQQRKQMEEAAERCCDTIDAGDEKMYRFSQLKILQFLLDRAKHIVKTGLPASLDDKFVTRALEKPVLSIKREVTIESKISEEAREGDEDSVSENFESQSTVASSTVSAVFSETSLISTATTVMDDSVPQDVTELQRLKIAFSFVTASYLPGYLADILNKTLESAESPVQFGPLNEWTKTLATLRAEALASRSLTDFSRKRGMDDEDATELRAEKKRRVEEEEKRKKAGESRGVRDLKKVNVAGMKKMSDFFTKKPATAKMKS